MDYGGVTVIKHFPVFNRAIGTRAYVDNAWIPGIHFPD